MQSAPPVTFQNEQTNRFELNIGGELAVIEYSIKKSSNQIFLVHTEVPKTLRGKGWGEKLVKEALEIVKAKGYKLVPLCPFVVTYLKKHKNYLDIIDDSKKAIFI